MEGGEELGVAQEEFAAAVVALVGGLAGVGASVIFEIEFAVPGFEVVALFHGVDVEVFGFDVFFDYGKAGGVAGASEALHVELGWTATAVAKSIEVEGDVTAAFVAVVFDAPDEFAGRAVANIGVDRRKVSPDGAAVGAFPPKGVVGDFVGLVPRHFLGEEGLDIEFVEDLGEGGGVAEDIGEEHVDGFGAEFVAEVAASVEELADKAFAAGEVTVGFDPHGAEGFPVAFFDRFFDAFEEVGMF